MAGNLRAANLPANGIPFQADLIKRLGQPITLFFELYGQEISLDQGRLVNSEGALAGAFLTMGMAVERAVQSVGLSLEHALQLAITNPAKVIKRPELASLLGRPVSDLVLID